MGGTGDRFVNSNKLECKELNRAAFFFFFFFFFEKYALDWQYKHRLLINGEGDLGK